MFAAELAVTLLNHKMFAGKTKKVLGIEDGQMGVSTNGGTPKMDGFC